MADEIVGNCEGVVSVSSPVYKVIGDGKMYYEGCENMDAWYAFIGAGKQGARFIQYFVDDSVVITSRCVMPPWFGR